MKVKKFTEEIQTKNFSDMENWTPGFSGEKKVTYTGNKKIDYELGSKVIDLLSEYELGIMTIGPGKWLHGQGLVLPDETNFQEYRVNICKKDWDNFIENYNDENDIKYDDLSEDELEKVQDIYNKLPYNENTSYGRETIEFSVFLPNNVTNINSASMSDASTYLKLLSDSGFRLFGGDFDEYDIFYHEVEPTKKFINSKKIKISNNNLEIINTISHRLHKDGKVFDTFKELLNDSESTAKQLFNEWLNLMK